MGRPTAKPGTKLVKRTFPLRPDQVERLAKETNQAVTIRRLLDTLPSQPQVTSTQK